MDLVWTTKPFDTLLFKNWPDEQRREFEMLIFNMETPFVGEALLPNKDKHKYFRDDFLRDLFDQFYNSPNLCDKYQICQDVMQHSTGLKCVTAAAIRKRLSDYFGRTHLFDDITFQNLVIRNSGWVEKRKNIGVLVFDFPNDGNNLRNHLLEVLYNNFYLYTTPVINRINIGNQNYQVMDNAKIHFIIKQISRNTDCVIIFVDNALAARCFDSHDNMRRILSLSLSYDFKIRVLILSLCPEADNAACKIYTDLLSLKPTLVVYQQLIIAPSGGLIALVEKSSYFNLKDSFLKYWYRGMEVFKFFKINIEDTDNEDNHLTV